MVVLGILEILPGRAFWWPAWLAEWAAGCAAWMAVDTRWRQWTVDSTARRWAAAASGIFDILPGE